jgi:hypothetical protein
VASLPLHGFVRNRTCAVVRRRQLHIHQHVALSATRPRRQALRRCNSGTCAQSPALSQVRSPQHEAELKAVPNLQQVAV